MCSSDLAFAAQWLLLVPVFLTIAVVIARRKWKRDLPEALCAGLATIAFVKIAGILFVERRPFVLEHLQPLVSHAPDNAFPSDHLAACGLAFAYVFPRSKPAAIAILLAAAAIAYARVAARLHWPGDVAAGFLLGSLAALLVRYCIERLAARYGSKWRLFGFGGISV